MESKNQFEEYYSSLAEYPVLKPITAAELQVKEMPELLWVVDSILPVGVCVLAAKPKRGKSFLALDLCLSICNGYDFLGNRTHAGACLYFDLESSQRRPKDRIETLLQGRPAPANLHIISRDEMQAAEREMNHPLMIGNGFEQVLCQFLDDHPEMKLVVIDIFARLRKEKNGKTDDYERDYRDFGSLIQIANDYKVCIMCVMHNTKMEHSDPFDDIQGSAGVMGSLDTAMVIQTKNRENNEAALYIRGRDIEEQTIIMSFDRGKWTKQGTAEEIDRQNLLRDYARSNVIKTVFSLLEDQHTWEGTATDIKQASIINGTPISLDPRIIGIELIRFEGLLSEEGVTFSKKRNKKSNVYTLIKD